ncbi:MAG: hypothetical protein EZS28_018086 [Streblomastix strix]|uniref:Uncharacterized protein n=1 Tax=Streblomastix strix TaxID=222440 RepID=A0A5J4VUS2_9EUKA|nr:MAG: hypothetical protein EZS28_018086 [Streblomastix strix]
MNFLCIKNSNEKILITDKKTIASSIKRDMKLVIQINYYEKDCRSSGTFISYLLNIVIRKPIKTVVKNMSANRKNNTISVVQDDYFATHHHEDGHHSHQESAMIPLSQSSTITQSSEKYLSLKSSSSSQTKKQADNPRDSFAIPYLNDYATIAWAYDLSSHPELLMATYHLKSDTQLNKSVLQRYKTVSDLNK